MFFYQFLGYLISSNLKTMILFWQKMPIPKMMIGLKFTIQGIHWIKGGEGKQQNRRSSDSSHETILLAYKYNYRNFGSCLLTNKYFYSIRNIVNNNNNLYCHYILSESFVLRLQNIFGSHYFGKMFHKQLYGKEVPSVSEL